MLMRFIRFLFSVKKEPEVFKHDFVGFKAYEQTLADEPRCSIYKKQIAA